MSLSAEMLRQPGFLVIAVYTGWIYAQIVLIIVLLGALASRYYSLRSTLVGLCVAFISIGGVVAIPFQKANLFSRWRHHQGPTSADTLDDRFVWTSHFVRRAVFCIFLPLFGIAYTVASAGPPIPAEIPTLLAAGIGGLSALAISECNGLIMETFDTSDLPVTSSSTSPREVDQSQQWADPSSYPRVAAGFAVCHAIGFVLAAIATAVGGSAQRRLGQQAATGVVAGILLILTGLLLAVLIRFKNVQIIPNCKTVEMDRWTEMRRESLRRQSQRSSARTSRTSSMAASNYNSPTSNKAPPVLATDDLAEVDMWRPILLGNPSCKMRRVNVLELGALSRWTEIRKANRLIDQRAAAHLNRAALGSAAVAVEEATGIAGLVRKVSHRRHHHHRGTDEEGFHSYNHHLGSGLHFHPGHRHVRGTESEDTQGIELAVLGRTGGRGNPPAHAGLQGNRENAAKQKIEEARDEFVGSSFDDYGTLRAREVKMRRVTGGELRMTF